MTVALRTLADQGGHCEIGVFDPDRTFNRSHDWTNVSSHRPCASRTSDTNECGDPFVQFSMALMWINARAKKYLDFSIRFRCGLIRSPTFWMREPFLPLIYAVEFNLVEVTMAGIRIFNVHYAWEDCLSMGLGALIVLTSWIVGDVVSQTVAVNAAIVGILVLALGASEFLDLRRWEEGLETACPSSSDGSPGSPADLPTVPATSRRSSRPR